MDFSQFEIVATSSLAEGLTSSPGVMQRLIEYDRGDVIRTTAVVHCAPGAVLPKAPEGCAEEILVLEGSIVDAQGRYSSGTYLRNPPGITSQFHASELGCVLFVKTWQPHEVEVTLSVINTQAGNWRPGAGPGLNNQLLASAGDERTVLVRWDAGTKVPVHTHAGVEETLVLDGEIEDEFHRYPAGTWFRAPRGSRHEPFSREGALILIKVGHVPAELDPV
jgi:anti-sigma factor ChrR (cupin superfamily)